MCCVKVVLWRWRFRRQQKVSGFTPTLPAPHQNPIPQTTSIFTPLLHSLLHITHTSGYQPLSRQNPQARSSPVSVWVCSRSGPHFRTDLHDSVIQFTGSNRMRSSFPICDKLSTFIQIIYELSQPVPVVRRFWSRWRSITPGSLNAPPQVTQWPEERTTATINYTAFLARAHTHARTRCYSLFMTISAKVAASSSCYLELMFNVTSGK